MKRLRKVQDNLAEMRPVFHAEADFQHAFAWAIQQHEPDAAIRLERRVPIGGRRAFLDIHVQLDGRSFALELKYKTSSIQVDIHGEEFDLLSHGAEDHGRYDYCKDVWRIEQLVRAGHADAGAAVLLSNESRYWREPRHPAPADAAFRIHEGRDLHGSLSWPGNANPNNTKGREAAVELTGRYTATWHDYSVLSGLRNGTFRKAMDRSGYHVEPMKPIDNLVRPPGSGCPNRNDSGS